MNYATYDPHPDLRQLVKCYWTLEAPVEAIPERQRIVPDGCMEMIFQLGDLYRQYLDDTESIVQPRCFVFGQITKPLEIEPLGKTDIFSVRFHPGGFIPFASKPLSEMENRAVALNELFANSVELEHEVLTAKSVAERISILEGFLLNHLSKKEVIDEVIRQSVELILELNGQLSVDQISDQVSVHRRQLERKFASLIGLSPKQLAKMVRMQATLRMLARGKVSSLTVLANEGDYYDQAHFSKDFKEFTGKTPGQYYAGNLRMTSLFVEND